MSNPGQQQDRAAIARMRQDIADLQSKLAALAARLEKEFPDYAALTSPKPLAAEDAQRLLGPDEVLAFWIAGEKETELFALTSEDIEWHTIAVGADALTQRIAAFRRGLDIAAVMDSLKSGKPDLFDLNLAHELYVALLGPVDALLKRKHSLLVVPSGALTAMPFNLLVTEKPAASNPNDFTAYRNVPWLINRNAVSVLPSVASLKALRVFAGKDQATKPLVGFGDPVFQADAPARPAQRAINENILTASAAHSVVKTRAYTDFWRGASVDRSQLGRALPQLPDTADEIKDVAAKVGASASDIYLGKAASETTLKAAPLADYRIVYFATHGLVAGDVKGLAEPSLALTLPKDPTPIDDGLLTASEVAQLKLKADWVVLSACNTAAGDKPGAEALSGLARAFFYAGAHALLVSHWAVASDAATILTTSTFANIKSAPQLGRAEALRRAMVTYMNDTSSPWNAYPAFWGPFAIVGEGTAPGT
jgi:CHAT domain-containing protein